MVSRGRDQRMLKGVEPQVEVLLSDLQVEEMTSGTIKASTLRWWRHLNNGTGPRWFKLGPRRVARTEAPEGRTSAPTMLVFSRDGMLRGTVRVVGEMETREPTSRYSSDCAVRSGATKAVNAIHVDTRAAQPAVNLRCHRRGFDMFAIRIGDATLCVSVDEVNTQAPLLT